MIIDVKQIEDIRSKILDLSVSLRDLVSNNKEYFKGIEDHVKTINVAYDNLKSVHAAGSLKGSIDSISNTITSLNTKGSQVDNYSQIVNQLSSSAKKAANRLETTIQAGPAKETTGFKKSSEFAALSALFVQAAARLMIPIPGKNVLANSLRWIIHGLNDAMNIQASAGEIKNLLVGAYEGAASGVVESAKQKLTTEQVVLEKFYNINKSAMQATIAEFAKSGVSISEMSATVSKSLGMAGDSLVSFATAVDLRLNLASGTTAKGMVSLVTNYNESMNTAKKLYTKLLFLGRETGVGPVQFATNVMKASEHLTTFGVSTEYVADMMVNLQEKLVGMNLEKQFSGKFVAEGVEDISSGLDNLSSNFKSLIAERMGWGMGAEGLMRYEDKVRRFARMSREERGDEFQTLIKTVYTMVKEAARGNLGTMYMAFKDQLDFGTTGSQLLLQFGEAFEKGDVFKQHDISGLIGDEMKNTLVTEAERTNKFQLLMNQWLSYIAQIGRGILTLLMEAVSNLMLFMSNMKELFFHIPEIIRSMMPNAIQRAMFGSVMKPSDIFGKLKWSVNPALGEAAMAGLKEGMKGLANVASEMGIAVAGAGGVDLNEYLGGGSGRPAESNFIMVPVSGSTPISTPIGTGLSSGRSAGSGGKPRSIFEEGGAREPLKIITGGVDEVGNIKVMLSGDCPRCGLHFGGGMAEDRKVESLPKVSHRKGSDADLPRTDISDYSGSGPVPLVASGGKLGGRFRSQSMRPGAKEGSAHAGIDAPAKLGTPTYAVEEGEVIHVGESKGSGRNVQVQHPSGETSWYMHLDKIAKDIKKGAMVKKGAAVGTVGRTQDVGGKGTTSPHLHYEVLKPGVSSADKVATPTSHSQENFGLREDPEQFVKGKGSTIFE